jgi:hypothetical protein
MSTPAQLAANRANAQRSTGPKTETGKQKARLNGYRHGLTGQIYIFTPEDQEAFDQHCTGIRESFAPIGAFELDLAQSIAEDRWRLKRARALESGIFALGQCGGAGKVDAGHPQLDAAFSQARTWLEESQNLQLLTLYESRIQRSLDKALAQLTTIQEKRAAAHQRAMEEAQLLANLSHMKGKRYDPAPDFPPAPPKIGSVISADIINRTITRNHRLDEARFYQRNDWNPKEIYRKPSVRIPQAA